MHIDLPPHSSTTHETFHQLSSAAPIIPLLTLTSISFDISMISEIQRKRQKTQVETVCSQTGQAFSVDELVFILFDMNVQVALAVPKFNAEND
jgi:hypothetical protein